MPVISFSSRKGEAGKMTAATSSDLAERTPWPRVPFEALLGLVLDEVGV